MYKNLDNPYLVFFFLLAYSSTKFLTTPANEKKTMTESSPKTLSARLRAKKHYELNRERLGLKKRMNYHTKLNGMTDDEKLAYRALLCARTKAYQERKKGVPSENNETSEEELSDA